MKHLVFPAASYIEVEKPVRNLATGTEKSIKVIEYIKTEDSIISSLELLWSAIMNSRITELSRKDHKVIKSLKKKVREITRYKDKDEDARIPLDGPQQLLLEQEEISMLDRLIDSNHFQAAASEDLDQLRTIIDEAKEFVPEKPTLMT